MQLCQQKRCTLMGVWWASLACLVLAAGVPEVGAEAKTAEGTVGQFFNLATNPFTFDNDALISGFSALDTKRAKRLGQWRGEKDFYASGNVAKHLHLAPLERLHLKVPLNLILVGFEGEGEHSVKLSEEEVLRWFQNMDFEVPHTRVPVDGYDPTHGAGPQLPDVSFVQYNYSMHIVEVDRTVVKTVQRALDLYKRPVDPTRPDAEVPDPANPGKMIKAPMQVDVTQMDALLDSLVQELGIDRSAYTLFVLNPKKGAAPYGYRLGFSDDEVGYLRAHQDSMPRVGGAPGSAGRGQRVLRDQIESADWQHKRAPDLFHWNRRLAPDSKAWAAKVDAMITTLERTRGVVREQGGAEKVLLEDAASLLAGSDPETAAYVRRLLDGEPVFESCLVDTWVSEGRYAWVDLSAGPMSWGPLVGGTGVRELHSLPSVDFSFGDLPPMPSHGAKLADALNAIMEKGVVEDDADADYDQDFVTIANAQLDAFEMFALEHCKDNLEPEQAAVCAELRKEALELQRQLDIEVAANMSGDKKHRDHQWNIFGVDPSSGQDKVMSAVGLTHQAAQETFLMETGAMVHSAMQMAFTPSVTHAAFHKHQKVSFLLYVVTTHHSFDPTAPSNFDVDALRVQLQRLMLRGQEMTLAVHKMRLSDDPNLALAYGHALRTLTVPSVDSVGSARQFHPRERRYLDSTTLQHQLIEVNRNRALHKRGERYTTDAAGEEGSVLEVPIFLLSLDEDSPVLIDKHFQAKSLPYLVLVVQNGQKEWRTHLQCNDKHVTQSLRSPLKAALAALAQHVGGVLPAHVSYSLPHAATVQNWLWSSGGHPMTALSSGHAYSQLHIDTAHRNYVLTAMDHAMLTMNEGIAGLAMEPTDLDTYALFRKLPLRALMAQLSTIQRLLTEAVNHMSKLDYDAAAELAPLIEQHSHGFRVAAETIAAGMHPAMCTRERSLHLSSFHLICVVIIVAGVALVAFLVPARHKPKVN